jgi:hypothetical protein
MTSANPSENTAYHEAGHAVVACALGADVGTVAIEGDKEGEVTSNVKGLTLPQKIKVAFAGPLAETKHRAAREWATQVRFDLSDPMTDVVRLVREPEYIECSSCILRACFITAAGEPKSFIVNDPNVFSDFDEDDVISRLASHLGGGEEQQLLKETRELLDQPAVWAQVRTVAEELVRTGRAEVCGKQRGRI